jgi:hypothetical protein
MRPISTRELRWLLGEHAAPCVSIYLPAESADPAANLQRFGARVEAAEKLLAPALSPAGIRELLEPVRQLSSAPFWRKRVDALALFRSPDVFTHYRIPARVPELTVVADSFHSRPLVRYLNSNRRHFYVLALAPDAVTILEGSPARLGPVDPEELPPELTDALADEKGRAYLAAQDAAPPGAQPRRRGENGSGGAGLERWFRTLDRALWTWLKDDLAPLILAGSPQHHHAYRAASRYPELLDDGIEEEVSALDPVELHARALTLIRARDADVLGALLAQLSSALSTGRADTDIQAIARAAVAGRVRILMFTADAVQWGRLDRRTGSVTLEDRQRDDRDADLVDDLAEVVLLTGGDVHELPERSLPAPLAAIYRR